MKENSSVDSHSAEALQRFHFGEGQGLTEEQAETLRAPWQPEAPGDPLAESSLRYLLDRASSSYSKSWRSWRAQEQPLISQLRSRVRAGSQPDGTSPGSALGALGSRFVDAAALAERTRSQNAEPIDGQRRDRLVKTLATLDQGLHGSVTRRPRIFCHPALEGMLQDLPDGVDVTSTTSPCVEVAAAFEEVAGEVAELLAAHRVARLELENVYDPDRHDLALERFDWRALHDDERPLLPIMICLLPYASAIGDQLGALIHLLGSAVPIQVVVPVDPLNNALSGALDLGDLALSHRRCFVNQGSTALAQELLDGFERAVESPCAALHLVAGELDPDQAWTSVASRCHPVFTFDPMQSRTDHTLSVDTNPQPESGWLEEPAAEQLFTIAELALASRTACSELALIEDAELAGLVPLSEWLSLDRESSRQSLPFIESTNIDDEPVRLLVSRRLALACAERLDHWRTLKRLAGTIEPRISAASSDGQTAEAPEQRQTSDLDLDRQRMAQEVVHRLMSQLLATSPPS